MSTAGRSQGTSVALLERLVLAIFGGSAGLTRPQLEELTGLSRPVVAGVVASLVERGELVEMRRSAGTGARGRPPACYQRAALLAPVLLIRLSKDGSTSASLVSADDDSDDPVRCAPWRGPWGDWSSSVARAVERVCGEAALPPRAAVVATSFPVTEGEGTWLDLDPRKRLARLFGCAPLLVNHASLAALGEARCGAAREHLSVVHVSVVNGIGAGFVFGGRLITGAHGFAGELAHIQISADGYPCICGNRGCLWTDPLVLPRLEIMHDEVILPAANEDGGEAAAGSHAVPLREYLPELGKVVGQALAPVITAYDPDCMVVDAGLGRWADHFTTAILAELERRCPRPVTERLTVVAGELEDAERSGALALADAHASGLLAASVTSLPAVAVTDNWPLQFPFMPYQDEYRLTSRP